MTNEERFTSINPEELPPELQPLYKSLQRDYTRKRQDDTQRAKAAEERAAALEEQYAELGNQFQAVRQYALSVEENNAKWQQWHKYLEESGQLENSGNGSGGVDASQGRAGYIGAQRRMSASDRELLATDVSSLSEDQLASFDKYFMGKYGNTFQQLTDNVTRLQKQLGYTLQINELLRTRGKDFDIDPKRIVDAAVEMGTDKLDAAFDKAYAKEIQEKEFQKRLDEEKAKWDSERKSTAMEGLTRSREALFYTRPDEVPRSYEQASQMVLDDLVSNPDKANAPGGNLS